MNLYAKIFKKIIYFTCRVFAVVLPYKRIEQLSLFKKILYTYWISGEFKSFGDKSLITNPIDIKGGKYIEIWKHVSIGKNSILNAWQKHQNDTYVPSIIIGNNTHLGEGCHISAITKIIIGNNVLTGRRVSIIDNSHGESSLVDFLKPPSKRKLSSKGPIIIEDNVWIGDKVTILSGVTIGVNSIIGANSVVSKNVPANSIVGGVPAKLIKTIK
jgi:acetyltransferase-like isoleucine patch superfamily enzyme